MNLMIASDLHGSAKYTGQLLEAWRREKADRLLLLGDLLYHGPRNDLPDGYAPKEVIQMLNGMRQDILAVRGNCEAEVDQMVLEFPVLSDFMLVEANGLTLLATHGHIYNEKNRPPMRAGEVLLTGHTHIPVFERVGDIVHVNPGSVSIPKAGSARGYVVLEGKAFVFRTLEGETYNRVEC